MSKIDPSSSRLGDNAEICVIVESTDPPFGKAEWVILDLPFLRQIRIISKLMYCTLKNNRRTLVLSIPTKCKIMYQLILSMSLEMLSKRIVNLEEKYLHEENNCVNVKDLENFAPPVHHLRRIFLLYCPLVPPEINPYKATASSCHSSGGE